MELKLGTTIGDYSLTVVTGGAAPQEDGGITRAWIEDPKVYVNIPMPQWWWWVLWEQRWLQSAVLLNVGVIAEKTCLEGKWDFEIFREIFASFLLDVSLHVCKKNAKVL